MLKYSAREYAEALELFQLALDMLLQVRPASPWPLPHLPVPCMVKRAPFLPPITHVRMLVVVIGHVHVRFTHPRTPSASR